MPGTCQYEQEQLHGGSLVNIGKLTETGSHFNHVTFKFIAEEAKVKKQKNSFITIHIFRSCNRAQES